MSSLHDAIPEFGELLRRSRHTAGLTQEELAEKAGLSVRGISDLERGARRAPQHMTLELLADALEISSVERDQWKQARRAAARRRLSRRLPPQPNASPPARADVRPQPIISNDDFPFVGRKHEIDQLRFAVDQSAAGTGRIWVLSGEPGIGKTRLAREVAGYARQAGSFVLWGNCHEQDGAPPYWPWVQIIRQAIDDMDGDTRRRYMGFGIAHIARIIPELREDLTGSDWSSQPGAEQARFELFDSIARFFVQLSLRKPLLIVIDDLHWSDQSTLLLLSFLTRELGQRSVVVLGTFRETDIDADHLLPKTLADLARNGRFSRLPLAGLSRPDIEQLVRPFIDQEFPASAESIIYERSAGNPFFFAAEIIRMIRGEYATDPARSEDWLTKIPVGIRDVISQRLARLTEACIQALTAAAVIGREFRLNVLELVAQRERDELMAILDNARRMGLIERPDANDGEFRFVHALVQETIYSGAPSVQLADLHRRAGEALEQIHRSAIDSALPDLAHHFARASASGNPLPAIRYGIQAGDQALARVAYNEAIQQYRRTLAVIESHASVSEPELLDVLLKLGDVYNHVGNREEARAVFLRAANISRQLDRPELFGRAVLGYTGLGIFVDDVDYAPLLEEAVAYLPEQNTALRARLLAKLAHELVGTEWDDRRAGLVRDAETIARQIGDPSTLIYVLIVKTRSYETIANLDMRLSIAGEVAALAAISEEAVLAAPARVLGIEAGLANGDIELVDQQIAEFTDLADRFREPQRKWFALVFRAMRATLEGRFPEAEALLTEAGDVAGVFLPATYHELRVASLIIAIRREQGRLDEVQHMLHSAAYPRSGPLYWRALCAYARTGSPLDAETRCEIDDLIEAIEQVEALDPNSLAAAALLSMTACASRLPGHGRRLYTIIAPHWKHHLLDSSTRHWYGPVSYFAGRLATSLGEWEAADRYLHHAVEVTTRMRARPLLAHSQFEMSKLLYLRDEPGDRDSADELLGKARDIARETGMAVLEQDIRLFRRQPHIPGIRRDLG